MNQWETEIPETKEQGQTKPFIVPAGKRVTERKVKLPEQGENGETATVWYIQEKKERQRWRRSHL